MSADFDSDKLENVCEKLEKSLKQVFDGYSYLVFDVTLEPKPKVAYRATEDFWGGYLLLFKFIEKEKAKGLSLESMRKQALAIGQQ